MVWWGNWKCTVKNERWRLYMQRSFCFFLGMSLIVLRKCTHIKTSEAVIWKTRCRDWCSCPVPEGEGDGRRDGAGQWLLRQLPTGAEANQGDWLPPALPFSHQTPLKLQPWGFNFQGFSGQRKVPGLCTSTLPLQKLLYLHLCKKQSYWFLSAVALKINKGRIFFVKPIMKGGNTPIDI